MHFRSSMERLHIWSDKEGWLGVRRDRMYSEMWHDFPFLRELFISQHSISAESLSAPNLAHLALECIDNTLEVQSILGLLCGCPLLEILLIHCCTRTWSHDQTPDHSPINLPNLRILEFGPHEATLMLYLRFPPGVAVGFREIMFNNEHGYFPPAVAAAIQDMVERAGVRRIILAVPTPSKEGSELLIRFDGLGGSLEMTTCNVFTREEVQGVLFGPGGVLFSHSPHIKNVKELHIVGCFFGDGQEFHHIYTAMPNLVSISFFRCEGHNFLGLLASINSSSPPFSYFERIVILGQESGLREIAKARKDCGIPLKTIIVGRGPSGFEYDRLEDYTELGQLVDDLRIGCPTEMLEWGIENEILNIWSASNAPGPVSPDGNLIVPG